MNALDFLISISENEDLQKLKYCLIDINKVPYRYDGLRAKPNDINDFVDFDTLLDCDDFEKYAGIGISIQASNITAIDVDKCFSIPFNLESADERAKDIINRFKNVAYIEFSFSGKGLRVLFQQPIIEDYSLTYYIKNDKNGIEFYQPSNSFRYVTITGKTIVNNHIFSNIDFSSILFDFLNTYMKRKIVEKKVEKTFDESDEKVNKRLRTQLLLDYSFQETWFSQAPGSNSNESQLDYYLIHFLYDNVVKDKDKLRITFESSPYFKSKDKKHINKWLYNNYRYYNYIYEHL